MHECCQPNTHLSDFPFPPFLDPQIIPFSHRESSGMSHIEGQLLRRLTELKEAPLLQLPYMLQLPPLSARDLQEVHDDHSRAIRYVTSIIEVKLDWTRRFPWKLALLAVADESLARQYAAELLKSFDATCACPDAQDAHHRHPVTLLYLHASGPLRPQLLRFIAGMPLQSLSLLHFYVASWRFVHIVERHIEASHSLAKRKGGTHSSGSAVSLTRRLWQLEHDLAADPSFFTQLVTAYEKVRSAKNLPKALGIQHHPVFTSVDPHTMAHSRIIVHVRKILYGTDSLGLFQDVSKAAAAHDRLVAKQRAGELKMVALPRSQVTSVFLLLSTPTSTKRAQNHGPCCFG